LTGDIAFDARDRTLSIGPVVYGEIAPLVDGQPARSGALTLTQDDQGWSLSANLDAGGQWRLGIVPSGDTLLLNVTLDGIEPGQAVDALGVQFGFVRNAVRFLRNGYMSWDGSFFVEPLNAAPFAALDPRLCEGHAMTGLVTPEGSVATIGFLRHDRFQSRIRFDYAHGPLSIGFETLLDRIPHEGSLAAETLILGFNPKVEEGLRDWARAVAAAAPDQPRIPAQRVAGWCSWYNLYASIDEPVLHEHLDAMAGFAATTGAPLNTFLIDDGFTPEMGDWLTTRPQFPNGMKPILDAIRDKEFSPGLWIAPFMVGNRSRLYRDHPDWVVRDRETGNPLAPMTFYGEFRWHKRSEEYYVLDITHPDAEAYIRKVFRTWTKDWGCRYFKTDFMHLGSMYGPDRAIWHQPGLSRMAIWMKMARLIREEIGDAQWLLCGAPIWAPVGLADAVRIGRDVGVSWKGHYSAQSLLRDQTARNFANGILWQADPDCILLRSRYHELTDEQIRSLALFAGLAGGILMTSDNFNEIPDDRRAMFADLAARSDSFACDFPELGQADLSYSTRTHADGTATIGTHASPVLVQRIVTDSTTLLNVFNTQDQTIEKRVTAALIPDIGTAAIRVEPQSAIVSQNEHGLLLQLAPFQSVLIECDSTPEAGTGQ
jgi:alpha-galactosidase